MNAPTELWSILRQLLHTATVHMRRAGILMAAAGVLLLGCVASVDPDESAIGIAPRSEGLTLPAHPLGRYPASVQGRVVLDQGGNPWLGVGDAGWSLFAQLSLSEAETYLDSLASKGFNLVLANLVEAYFLYNSAGENYAGDSAWAGAAFQSSLNAAYWDHVDAIIKYGASKGITFLVCPGYIGYERGEQGWSSRTAAATDAEMRDYGSAVGSRLKEHPNLMWLIGHDATPDPTDLARQGAMWLGIKDSGDTHLMTVGAERSRSGYDAWKSWDYLGDVDFDTAYVDVDDPVSVTSTAYDNGLPVILLEGRYEDAPAWTDAAGRYQFAGGFAAGALAGYISGHEGVWGFGVGIYDGANGFDWDAELDDASYVQSASIGEVLAGMDWSGLRPDTSDIFLRSGEESGSTQAAAAFGPDVGAIVYAPDAREVTLDLTKIAGSMFTITRVDPASGSATVVTRSASGVFSLPALGTNSASDTDWLVLVESSDPPEHSDFGGFVPTRLLDTRSGNSTVDGQMAGLGSASERGTLELPVAGRGGVPADAVAVVVNVTVTRPERAGHATVFPTGRPRPHASNLNYLAGQTVPNLVVVPIGDDGSISIYTHARTHLIADVSGYFAVQ